MTIKKTKYAPFLVEESGRKSHYIVGFVKDAGRVYPLVGKEECTFACKVLNAIYHYTEEEQLQFNISNHVW